MKQMLYCIYVAFVKQHYLPVDMRFFMFDGIKQKKKRIFDIIQIGNAGDFPSILFDVLMTVAILCNLFIAIFDTFEASASYKWLLHTLECVTVVGFTVEYVLRVWTADYLYPGMSVARARWKYVLSFTGIIDLLSFLPFYLPIFFPAGIVAFRMFRVIRIFRLFRVNRYYDAFNVISDVLRRKRGQIVSSVLIILILMTASSLCMYGLEHEAQPEVFKNAFSGFWWSVSTLLTVGYGDIYPVTVAGRIFGIIITFLGVGMVAIPTGILSAGFVEQYATIRESANYLLNEEMRFVRLQIGHGHPWIGQKVDSLKLPKGLFLAMIQRPDGTMLAPYADTLVGEGDAVVLSAESGADHSSLTLREIILGETHPWNGCRIRDLDLSRQTLIVMIRRDGDPLVPRGDTVLQEKDEVFLCTRKNIADSKLIRL